MSYSPPLCILNFICRTRLVYNSITRVNWWRQLSDIGGLDMREMLVIFFWCHIFSFIFVTSEAGVVDNVPMVSYWKTNENRIMSNSDSDVISSQWLNLNVGLYSYIPYVYTTWSVLLLCHDNKNKNKKKKSVKSIEAWTQHSPIRQHVTSSCYFHPSGVCIHIIYLVAIILHSYKSKKNNKRKMKYHGNWNDSEIRIRLYCTICWAAYIHHVLLL